MLYSVLHVCTSCRTAGSPREPRENRPGFKLYQELRTLLNQSPLKRQVEVRPAECLSLCPRPCGISLSSVGKWSYLFGDQKPRACARDIMELVSLYLSTNTENSAANSISDTARYGRPMEIPIPIVTKPAPQ